MAQDCNLSTLEIERQDQKSKAILSYIVSPGPAWAFLSLSSPPAEALLDNSRKREENSGMERVGTGALEPKLNYRHLHVLICEMEEEIMLQPHSVTVTTQKS